MVAGVRGQGAGCGLQCEAEEVEAAPDEDIFPPNEELETKVCDVFTIMEKRPFPYDLCVGGVISCAGLERKARLSSE